MIIVTDRLDLIAGILQLVVAEHESPKNFANFLKSRVPENWPPALNDRDSMNWCKRYFEKHADAEGWANWYFVLRGASKVNAC